ncbi:GNAT family N-acetyltransferase [Acinetobacter ursingii]|uniref:GNAT family N-acetyltransferase n=1 Tax=Acinetobacter ursingii TaxID=108980 RepID=UPI0032B47075
MELIVLTDLAVINAVLSHSAIHGDISDDLTTDSHLDHIPKKTECLGVMSNGLLHGLYFLVPMNGATVEIHTCLLPTLRGKGAVQAGKMLLSYLFDRYLKAISFVPINNKKAKLYALTLGFRIEGINRQSFLINNELIDQCMVGLTKGDYICQQQQQWR